MTNPNYPADDFSSSDADLSSAELNASEPETSSDLEPAVSDSTSHSTQPSGKAKGSFAASTWMALIVGFLLLIVLIVFIMQNQHDELPGLVWRVPRRNCFPHFCYRRRTHHGASRWLAHV